MNEIILLEWELSAVHLETWSPILYHGTELFISAMDCAAHVNSPPRGCASTMG